MRSFHVPSNLSMIHRNRQGSKGLTQPWLLLWEHHCQTLLAIQDSLSHLWIPVCDIPVPPHPWIASLGIPGEKSHLVAIPILRWDPGTSCKPSLQLHSPNRCFFPEIRIMLGVFWDRDVPPALVPDVLHSWRLQLLVAPLLVPG